MPGAARLSDISTGHNCFPPRPNIQASPDVIINDRGAHRQSDAWMVHCRKCFPPKCHPGNLASGSPSVLTNNLQQGRVNDPVSCGDTVATGSGDVIVGP